MLGEHAYEQSHIPGTRIAFLFFLPLMCMHVHICVRSHICASTHVHVCACLSRPGAAVGNLSIASTLFFRGSISSSDPETAATAGLTSQFALAITCVCLPRLELKADHHAHLTFT